MVSFHMLNKNKLKILKLEDVKSKRKEKVNDVFIYFKNFGLQCLYEPQSKLAMFMTLLW